jgi:hypothetical protein
MAVPQGDDTVIERRYHYESKTNVIKSVDALYELVCLSWASIVGGVTPGTEIVGWHRRLQSQRLAQTG